MTNEEVERAIQFLLEQDAKSIIDMEQMREEWRGFKRDITEALRQLSEVVAQTRIQSAESEASMRRDMAESEASMRRHMAESEASMRRHMAESEASMRRHMAESSRELAEAIASTRGEFTESLARIAESHVELAQGQRYLMASQRELDESQTALGQSHYDLSKQVGVQSKAGSRAMRLVREANERIKAIETARVETDRVIDDVANMFSELSHGVDHLKVRVSKLGGKVRAQAAEARKASKPRRRQPRLVRN
jgi:uncharacterized membrane-anchored protein YhcB (DUF1043 family)